MNVSPNNAVRDELYASFLASFLVFYDRALALALNEGLGWPIVAVMRDDTILHVGVRDPRNGWIFDARRYVSDERFAQINGIEPPYQIYDLDLTVRRLPLVPGETEGRRKQMICQAREIAEMLWPRLPWVKSLLEETQQFADELNQLCAKHGRWLVPTGMLPFVVLRDTGIPLRAAWRHDGSLMLVPT